MKGCSGKLWYFSRVLQTGLFASPENSLKQVVTNGEYVYRIRS